MASVYDRPPTMLDRVVGARLVVIGSVRRVIEVRADEFTDGRVFGTLELDVSEVIFGEVRGDKIPVRLVGEGDAERPRWIVPAEEGRRLVWFLTPDSVPGQEGDVYAPVFAGGFPIDEDGVHVPAEAVDQVTTEVTGAKGPPIPIEALRRLIDEIAQQRDQQFEELNRVAPAAAISAPYPPVQEMPQDEVSLAPRPVEYVMGGGEPAELEPPEE